MAGINLSASGPNAGIACSIKSKAMLRLIIAPSREPIVGSGEDIGDAIGGVPDSDIAIDPASPGAGIDPPAEP